MEAITRRGLLGLLGGLAAALVAPFRQPADGGVITEVPTLLHSTGHDFLVEWRADSIEDYEAWLLEQQRIVAKAHGLTYEQLASGFKRGGPLPQIAMRVKASDPL